MNPRPYSPLDGHARALRTDPAPDAAAVLAQSTFFSALGPAARRSLAEVCIARDARRGDVLFREGEEGHSLYVCLRGRIRLHKAGPDGGEVVIKVVVPGETFAEVVLFESHRFPVTATALTDCSLYLVPRRDVRALLRNEGFRDEFIQMLMSKLRHMAERVPLMTVTDTESRLENFLREQFGDVFSVDAPMTKKDVAAAIGATPETLSRILAKMSRKGTLRWTGGRMEGRFRSD